MWHPSDCMDMSFRERAASYREFGWRWNRAPYRPLVFCYAANRYLGSGDTKRLRPMLAYECRRRGHMLWAMGSHRWGKHARLR